MAGKRQAATIRFEGMREFRRALKDVGDDLEDLKATHKDAAEIVARRAAVISPQRDGMLRDSIDSRGTKTKGYVRAGGRHAVYAGPIHFGSPRGWPPDGFGGFGKGRLNPQPFLYDALDQRRAEVLDEYGDRIDDLARRRGLK